MIKYIDADSLRKWFEDQSRYYEQYPGNNSKTMAAAYKIACSIIDTWPTVNLIHCKECKYYDTACYSDGTGWCDKIRSCRSDNWFCADGEAKHTDDTLIKWKMMTPSEELSRDIENSYYELGKRKMADAEADEK